MSQRLISNFRFYSDSDFPVYIFWCNSVSEVMNGSARESFVFAFIEDQLTLILIQNPDLRTIESNVLLDIGCGWVGKVAGETDGQGMSLKTRLEP
jgi:hypothetical protein